MLEAAIALIAIALLAWARRCPHTSEMFTRNAEGKRTFTCAGCGRQRVSGV